jgi:hypothetical protein
MSETALLIWLREAERCQRIARSINDEATSARLVRFVYEARAKAGAVCGGGNKDEPPTN